MHMATSPCSIALPNSSLKDITTMFGGRPLAKSGEETSEQARRLPAYPHNGFPPFVILFACQERAGAASASSI
jgi:hypothetical protein